jgi:hypothetical protein
MRALYHKIWNSIWRSKTRAQNKIKQGTIYLRGEQSHFQAAIVKALGFDGKNSRLNFDITIDLLESFKANKLTYRVDYVVERSPTTDSN